MEMHQIRYFLALSETLNFTQAAEQCNVAQPSLTRAIKSLEAELGGELLRRERSLSHLTDLGERMLPLMRQCYDTAQAAKSIAQSMRKGQAAGLSLAVSHTVSIDPFAPMLREMSRAFPGLQLKLRRGGGEEIAESLKSGEVELAIAGPLGNDWERIDRFPLFEEPFDLFVGAGHRLEGGSAGLGDLARETLLVDAQCDMSGQLMDRLRNAGVGEPRAHRVATQVDQLALLQANLGVAVLPVGIPLARGIGRVPLRDLGILRDVSVYSVAGRRRDSAAATFYNMLRAADWPVRPANGSGGDGRSTH